MGAVDTTYTFTATDTITSTKMNNIIDQTVITDAAIIGNTLEVASGKLKVRAQGITSNEMAAGSVTSNAIADGTIVNADINTSAAIAGTKISPNFGSQNIGTTGTLASGNATLGSVFLSRENSIDEGGDLRFAKAIDNTLGFRIDCYGSTSSPDLRFIAGSSVAATLTTNGNLGIGTQTPNSTLSVTGSSEAYDGSGTEGIFQITTGTGAATDDKLQFGVVNSDYSWIQAVDPGATTRDLILNGAGGNVGIGTTDPTGRLSITTSSGSTSLKVTDGTNSTLEIKHASPGNLLTYETTGTAQQRWVLNGGERMRLLPDGKVGIGKTNPSTILDVNGTVTATAFAGPLTGNVTGNVTGNIIGDITGNLYGGVFLNRENTSNEGGQISFAKASDNSTAFSVDAFGSGSTPNLRVFSGAGSLVEIKTDNGFVGLGTSSPSTRLDVNGTATATAFVGPLTGDVTGTATRASNGPLNNVFIQSHTANTDKIHVGGFGPSGGSKGIGMSFQRDASEDARAVEFRNQGGTVVGSIQLPQGGGTIYAGTSDYRLKEECVILSDGLAKVNALKPTNFKWIESGTRVNGFIAHEVQGIVPDAVVGEKDAVDLNGNPIYQQMDQSKLIPIMVAAIQELSQKVAELEAR